MSWKAQGGQQIGQVWRLWGEHRVPGFVHLDTKFWSYDL